MQNLKIRQLKNTPDDQKILNTFDQKLAIYEGDLDVTMKYPLKVKYGNDLASARHYVAVLEKNGIPIGYGTAKVRKMTEASGREKYGLINTLFIEKEYRGKSFSNLIFQALKKWLNNQGINVIRLETFANNASLRVYKKWGFNPYIMTLVCQN